MTQKNNKNIISGYVMASVGFAMLAVNAVGYIFNLGFKAPALTVMGLVFATIGMTTVRKSRQ